MATTAAAAKSGNGVKTFTGRERFEVDGERMPHLARAGEQDLHRFPDALGKTGRQTTAALLVFLAIALTFSIPVPVVIRIGRGFPARNDVHYVAENLKFLWLEPGALEELGDQALLDDAEGGIGRGGGGLFGSL